MNKVMVWVKYITARESGSFVDSLMSAIRIRVGSALAPAPVADRTLSPLRTQAARRATCSKGDLGSVIVLNHCLRMSLHETISKK